MYCNQCGHKNPENAKFCSQCGSKLEVIEAAPASSEVPEPVQQPSPDIVSEPPAKESISHIEQTAQANIDSEFLANYMPAAEFGKIIRRSEEMVIDKIKAGDYKGRIKDGIWYVHLSEIGSQHSQPSAAPDFFEQYVPAAEFGKVMHRSEQMVIDKIKSGDYQGRLKDGTWYVHRSELGAKSLERGHSSQQEPSYISAAQYAAQQKRPLDEVIQKIRDGELDGRLENNEWVIKLGSYTPGSSYQDKDGKIYTYIDSKDLHAWTKAFIYFQIVIAALSFVSAFMELNMIEQIALGVPFSQSALEANDARQQAVGFLEVGLFVIGAIFIAKWIYRANYNARALGARGMEYTPGWSVGYYFIPILNLWKPYSAMKEIWRASIQPVDYQKINLPGVVHLWWILWIIGSLVGNASWRLSLNAESLTDYRMLDYLYMTSNVLTVAGAFALLNIMNQICQVQLERRQAA